MEFVGIIRWIDNARNDLFGDDLKLAFYKYKKNWRM